MSRKNDLLTIKEAAELTDKSKSNINYLLQYNRINRYNEEGEPVENKNKGEKTYVSREELKEYLRKRKNKIRELRNNQIGEYDEDLAFDELREKERTKHVHRLHPYKGKFIPQLVEYFLERNFKEGEVVLDPFMGSGTTLVQAQEMGIKSIGVDISPFNCLISKVKTKDYDIELLEREINKALKTVKGFSKNHFEGKYQSKLKDLVSNFNNSKLTELREKYDEDIKENIEKEFYDWFKKKKEKLPDKKII